MGANESLFKPFHVDMSAVPQDGPAGSPIDKPLLPAFSGAASTARLHSFDLTGRPVLSGLNRLPGELIPARSIVTLRQAMLGATVLVLHEDGDCTRPIIVGVLEEPCQCDQSTAAEREPLAVQADGGRLLIIAEREIVLRCGDSSITLTRGGKVIITGNHIVSRSRGYNKIKGAAIDIN